MMKAPSAAAGQRRLCAFDDDVGRAEFFDLLLGLIAHAFAQGDEPDDRRDADQNPQHRQAGPQLVDQQAFEAEF